jgi:hypothetical protein
MPRPCVISPANWHADRRAVSKKIAATLFTLNRHHELESSPNAADRRV